MNTQHWYRRSELGKIEGKGQGLARQRRVDLGLALLSVARKPGVELSCRDIAAWCDCSEEAVRLILQKALQKLHFKLKGSQFIKEVLQNYGEGFNSRKADEGYNHSEGRRYTTIHRLLCDMR